MITYFISGPMWLTQEWFDQHYKQKILDAVLKNDKVKFVVPDAPGCDVIAQVMLLNLRNMQAITDEQITVYHMLEKPRNNVGNFPTMGGFKTDLERDEALTNASDEDIAWYVDDARGRRSGTAKNIKRRKEKNDKLRCAEIIGWPTVRLRQYFSEHECCYVNRIDPITSEPKSDDVATMHVSEDFINRYNEANKKLRAAREEFSKLDWELNKLIFEQNNLGLLPEDYRTC